jgi:endogenous inhibitor of DNA gyrase (YacG/DUF329 family)
VAVFCGICDSEIQAPTIGRPREFCSRRCRHAAALWAQVEELAAAARATGNVELAEQREAWLRETRANARNGWAGAQAAVDAANAAIRRRR